MYRVHDYSLLDFLDHEVGASFDNLTIKLKSCATLKNFLSWVYVEDCLSSPLANVCRC